MLKLEYFSNIDDTEFLENFFDELSDKHRKAGVDASGMDVFGKVFCKVMRPILLGIIFVGQGCIFLLRSDNFPTLNHFAEIYLLLPSFF